MRGLLAFILGFAAITQFTPASAATLASPAFSASVDYDGATASGGGIADFGGSCDRFSDTSGCDLVDGSAPQLLVNWIDGDSFDLQFFGDVQNTSLLSTVIFEMAFSGLVEGGVPVRILDVVLNRAQSSLDGFLQGPGNPTGALFEAPLFRFTDTTLMATFGNYSGQLDGDGPVFRIDLLTAPVMASVPAPAALWLLASGLALLGAARRSKK